MEARGHPKALVTDRRDILVVVWGDVKARPGSDYFLSLAFCFAHRFFCAAEILARAAADIFLRRAGRRAASSGIAGLTADP